MLNAQQTALLNIELIEVEELESKIAPDSGSVPVTL